MHNNYYCTCIKAYTKPRGMITAAKIGVAIRITMIVDTTVKTVMMNPRSDRGIVSSMVYTSLEKRFRIRPSGVVSKNDIGDRIMLSIIALWSFFEANMPPSARANAAKRTNRA